MVPYVIIFSTLFLLITGIPAIWMASIGYICKWKVIILSDLNLAWHLVLSFSTFSITYTAVLFYFHSPTFVVICWTLIILSELILCVNESHVDTVYLLYQHWMYTYSPIGLLLWSFVGHLWNYLILSTLLKKAMMSHYNFMQQSHIVVLIYYTCVKWWDSCHSPF